MRMMEAESSVEARNGLIVAHIGLVKALASRLARRVPSQVDVTELVSAGMIGLVDAASRYRPALGVPFDAFARRRVHGAMLDSLRGVDWAPRSARKMRRDLDGAISRVRHKLNREPNEAEIATELNVSEDDYARMLDQVRVLDVGMMRESSSGTSLIDLAIDPDDTPYERVERAELRKQLAEAVSALPERERRILALYYEHELTLAEIGRVLGVGESRVCQLRSQAVARLRARLRDAFPSRERQQ